jgi:hypothetical protein
MPRVGDRLRTPGGDGDQAFFARLGIQRLTEPDWVPGKISGWGRPCCLSLKVENFPVNTVALTTKSVTGIADQISRRGSAGVVLHSIKNPVSFDGSSRDADAIGMAVSERA